MIHCLGCGAGLYSPPSQGSALINQSLVFPSSQEGRLCKLGGHWLPVRKAQRISLNIMASNRSRSAYQRNGFRIHHFARW